MNAPKGSYEAVFGHLGMTPDEIGNRMIALDDALRAALPGLRTAYLTLAEKYAGTRFENDPAYLQVKAMYENAKAALAGGAPSTPQPADGAADRP